MERSSWNYPQSGQRTALPYNQTGYQSQPQPQTHPVSYPTSYPAGPAPFPHPPSSLQQGGAPAGSSFNTSYGQVPANYRSLNPRNGGPSTQPSGTAPAEASSATSRGVPGTYGYPPQQQAQPQPPPPPPPPPQQQPQPPQPSTQFRNGPSMSGQTYTTPTQNRGPPGAQPPSGYGAPNIPGPPPQGYGTAPGAPHQHERYHGGPTQGPMPMPMYGQNPYFSQDSAVSSRPAMVQTRSGDPNQVRSMGAPQSSMGDYQKNMASIARAAFLRADSDQNGYLDVKEFMDTLRSLNIHISYHDYLLRFSQMDVDKDGRIGEEEFIRVYIQELQRRWGPYSVPR